MPSEMRWSAVYPIRSDSRAWDGSATRAWFARALWQTLDSYFGNHQVP